MPTPRKGEREKDFINRCIPIVINDKTAKNKEQAAAICYSKWQESHKDENMELDTKDISFETKEIGFELKEIDESSDNNFFIVKGIASTTSYDRNGDIIAPEAYNRTFEEIANGRNKIRALWQHQRYEPIGMPFVFKRIDGGSRIYTEIKMPKEDTLVSGRIIPQLRVGSVDSMSIGFYVLDSEKDINGVRTIKDMLIREVSLVTFPGNDEATITEYKTIDVENKLFNYSEKTDTRALETQLINGVKFSKNSAKKLISCIKAGLAAKQREVVEQQREAEEKSAEEKEYKEKCITLADTILKNLNGGNN